MLFHGCSARNILLVDGPGNWITSRRDVLCIAAFDGSLCRCTRRSYGTQNIFLYFLPTTRPYRDVFPPVGHHQMWMPKRVALILPIPIFNIQLKSHQLIYNSLLFISFLIKPSSLPVWPDTELFSWALRIR